MAIFCVEQASSLILSQYIQDPARDGTVFSLMATPLMNFSAGVELRFAISPFDVLLEMDANNFRRAHGLRNSTADLFDEFFSEAVRLRPARCTSEAVPVDFDLRRS